MKLPVIIVRVFQTTGVSQGPEQGQSESTHLYFLSYFWTLLQQGPRGLVWGAV
jgi:hypothetical protein